MVKKRVWHILNVSLGLIALFLFLSLVGVSLPSVGKAKHWLNPQEPICAVEWKGNITIWADLDRCCLQARQQLLCQRERNNVHGNQVHWACQTGSGNVVRYLLNTKAYGYCHLQPYWG